MTAFVYTRGRNGGGLGRKMGRTIGARRINDYRQPKVRPRAGDVVINYGNSKLPSWAPRYFNVRWVNHPDHIAYSANKLTAFRKMQARDVPTVEWTADQNEAVQWCINGHQVYARTILAGTAGAGIVVVRAQREPRNWPAAPLYTKRFANKYREYRYFVAGGNVIDVSQKKRMNEETLIARGIELDDDVRTHNNGWVFAHQGIVADPNGVAVSTRAVAALGLDYGAVDLLVADGKYVVCEVNSAPGWRSPTTFNAFLRYFQEVINAAA